MLTVHRGALVLHIALHSVGVRGVHLMGSAVPFMCNRMLRQAVHSAQMLLRMLLHAGWSESKNK